MINKLYILLNLDQMEYFFDTVLSDTVKVHPAHLHKELHGQIADILRSKYEGICSRFGFVNEGSIEILEVGKGIVEIHTFHGFVLYNVKFRASICNPAIGSLMLADVVNMNSFGILCASAYCDVAKNRNIVDTIIPRQVNDMLADPIHLSNIKVGDRLQVEIIGKKYQLKHNRISTIGKVVENKSPSMNHLEDILDTQTQNGESDGEGEDEGMLVVNDDNSSDENASERSFGAEDMKDLEEETIDDTGESVRNDELSENED